MFEAENVCLVFQHSTLHLRFFFMVLSIHKNAPVFFERFLLHALFSGVSTPESVFFVAFWNFQILLMSFIVFARVRAS